MKNKSFTLIELLVVISIIVILTGVVFINYRSGEKTLALQRSANKLAQDIRRAQVLATASEKCQSCGPSAPVPSGGYGIYLEQGDNFYILYADGNGNEQYGDSEDRELERIYLEKGVHISISANSSSVNFRPPDPQIKFTGGSSTTLTISLSLDTDPLKTKKITVNKVGLVEIQ
jgi:prepilin-type N-terminal cleavage/methylation domain-containing protein